MKYQYGQAIVSDGKQFFHNIRVAKGKESFGLISWDDKWDETTLHGRACRISGQRASLQRESKLPRGHVTP